MKSRNDSLIKRVRKTGQEGKAERILARSAARELTPEELTEIAGGLAGTSYCGPGCCADDCVPC
jgi:hypothetical protein